MHSGSWSVVGGDVGKLLEVPPATPKRGSVHNHFANILGPLFYPNESAVMCIVSVLPHI